MIKFSVGDKVIAKGEWEKYNGCINYNHYMVSIAHYKKIMTISKIIHRWDGILVKVKENPYTWVIDDLEKYKEAIKSFKIEEFMI